MKNVLCMVVIFYLALSACTKSETANALKEDNGCIERIVIPVTAHSINSLDVPTVDHLFSSNGIDNSKFRYFRYVHDTLQTQYPPFTKYDEKRVRVDQYINGVRLFTGDLVYNFLNNNFNIKSGHLTNGTLLDTVPKLTLGKIRRLFLDNIEQYDHAEDKFRDTCFYAEFGYFNLNAGVGDAQEILVKAWRVTPKGSVFPSEYPVAYYQDKDGQLIYYDNGIRTFK